MKIAFLCPYFGKFPDHFQLLLNSCSINKDCEWFIFTDDEREFSFPKNVHMTYMTLCDFKKICEDKFGFKISLESIRKLGDYKPALGFIFEDLIKGFDAWGHLDLNDSIYGKICDFITDEIISSYDKILFCGHMSIYKNTHLINTMFMKKLNNGVSFLDVYTDSNFYNFEEIGSISISQIFIENNLKMYNMENDFADISNKTNEFRTSFVSLKNNVLRYKMHKSKKKIYSFEENGLFEYSICHGNVIKREIMYIHFKRRKMNVLCNNNSMNFIIVPNKFISDVKIDKNIIKFYSKHRTNFSFYFDKIKNIFK